MPIKPNIHFSFNWIQVTLFQHYLNDKGLALISLDEAFSKVSSVIGLGSEMMMTIL